MTAFEVYLNDKKLCLAGIGEDGVLDVMIDHVVGRGRNESSVSVGGLISPKEHVRWIEDMALKAGDEVKVKVVESESIDTPLRRFATEPFNSKDDLKHYVRQMAKKLGWTITEA